MYLFSWNFIQFKKKNAHQSAKFQTFDCSGEISANILLGRLLLLKLYKISAKEVQELRLMILKSSENVGEKSVFCFKKDKNLLNFDLSIK